MADENKPKSAERVKFDDTLKRMLSTPPKSHDQKKDAAKHKEKKQPT